MHLLLSKAKSTLAASLLFNGCCTASFQLSRLCLESLWSLYTSALTHRHRVSWHSPIHRMVPFIVCVSVVLEAWILLTAGQGQGPSVTVSRCFIRGDRNRHLPRRASLSHGRRKRIYGFRKINVKAKIRGIVEVWYVPEECEGRCVGYRITQQRDRPDSGCSMGF